jgi:hypothetical protein
MTRGAIAGDTHVVKTFHLEIGGAGVAGITRGRCLNVIDGLRSGGHSCANRMTTGTILGGIFEYAINVALFASQCEVNVFQHKSGLRMVKRAGIRGRFGCRLGLNRKTKQKGQQYCRCNFDDAIDFY